MGRTWPNLKADKVDVAGYYWNERLSKLARLQVGEKLPRKPGRWEFIAHDHDGSSSEIVRRVFDRYPGMNINEFTFTVRSPLGRRLPIGDRRGVRALGWMGSLAAVALTCAGIVWVARRVA